MARRPRSGGAGIGVGQPVADVKEFADSVERVDLLHGSVAVDGAVAETNDDLGFGENGFACGGAEGRFVDKSVDLVLIG